MQEMDGGPRAPVLIAHSGSVANANRLRHATSRQQFRGETEVGRTAHLIVYTDGSPAGDASARAVLASAEADYAAVADWFGGIPLPAGQQGDDQTTPRTATPVQVLMDAQAGGAYHFGCNATDLYIEPDPKLATGFMVAELVEVFEAAAGNGWDCGHANGEGLSRALAGDRNPALVADLLQTEQAWWANGHHDYVANNDADDRDENSNGCCTLFLYYLHSQLGHSWQQICTTGGSSLGATYQRLSGRDASTGFNDFVTLLSSLDQGGQLNLPASGNPFPLSGGATAPAAPAAPAVPAPAPAAPDPAVPDAGTVNATSGGGSGGILWTALGALVVIAIVVGILFALGIIGH
ncbi:MAG TPA: hypothetical protein VGR57_04355 [Ktedonobacterales bacterium]|nr:hypothetical protein [Ktedonobacterales bacterium]